MKFGVFVSVFLLNVLIMYDCNSQNIVVKPYVQDACPHEMKIMWEADNIGEGSVIWGLDPFSLDSTTMSSFITGSGLSRIHVAQLDQLTANTKYYYKVEMNGGQLSALYNFRTPASHSDEKATQIIAMSDMQRDGSFPNKFNEIVDLGIIPTIASHVGPYIDNLEAVVIPGDLVANGGAYAQWKDHFFNPADTLFSIVPVYPVPGNHEYFNNGLPNFLKYFSLPTNGPASISEQCWYKDISNIRIIGLNSNSGTSDQNIQLDWMGTLLDSTCSAQHIDFVFAQLHHPFKSELWTPGENDFTGKVIDSLTMFSSGCGKPSIHFFGHTHAYSRGQSRDHKHLWINVATAGGAIDNWGEFPNADYEEFVKSQDEYGFVLIDVEAGDNSKFTIKRFSRGDQDITVDNVLTDELTIYKSKLAPPKPINIFPAGDTLFNNCIELKASQFYSFEDSLQASHWQVALGNNFIDSLVASNWHQNENFYFDVNLQENDDLTNASITTLTGEKSYFWRVRYRDQNLEWSPWSMSTAFFVESNGDTLASNLIINGGAENGIVSWTGEIESLLNAECNSVAPFQGSYNFAVGGVCQNEINVGTAYQDIDLTPYSTDIDANLVSADFGSYMRNFSGSDVPEMYLEFYDNGSLILTSNTVSNASASWTFVNAIIGVPAGATVCRVVLKGTRNSGSDNDSYFDEVQLILLSTILSCPACYGDTDVDNDSDGFCNDFDCDDNNDKTYPGALELCDGLDNNCDGVADNGTLVSWTGNAGTMLWGDKLNWDQELIPLPCQDVLIANNQAVIVDSFFVCKSITLMSGNALNILSNGRIIVEGDGLSAPLTILGTMIVSGECEIRP